MDQLHSCAPARNHVLDRLGATLRDHLAAAAQVITFSPGWSPAERASFSTTLLFPSSGILSVRAGLDGDPGVEVAMIGREGVVGAPACFTDQFRVTAMTTGEARAVDTAHLPDEIRKALAVDPIIVGHRDVIFLQVSHATLAAARRTVAERLARWLLMAFDRLDSDTALVTHDALSAALGVRRPGITVATHELEGIGAIRARRGTIRLLDRARLLTASRGCYGGPEETYRRIVGEVPRRPDPAETARISAGPFGSPVAPVWAERIQRA